MIVKRGRSFSSIKTNSPFSEQTGEVSWAFLWVLVAEVEEKAAGQKLAPSAVHLVGGGSVVRPSQM